MKNTKAWVGIIVIAVIVLIVAFTLGKKNNPPVPVDPVVEATRGWESHRDEEFGFRIRYPKDFTFLRNDTEFEGKFVAIRIPEALSAETGLSTESSITVLATTSPEVWCLTNPYTEKKPSQTKTLAGTSAYYDTATESAAGFKAEHEQYFLFLNNKCYQVEKQLVWQVGQEKDLKKVSDMLDLIIATFSFL